MIAMVGNKVTRIKLNEAKSASQTKNSELIGFFCRTTKARNPSSNNSTFVAKNAMPI